jgi:hypothetical protein
MSLLDKATILPIQSDDICHYEEFAIPFILDALEHTDGESSLSAILSDIANRKRQLWLVKADNLYIAAVVTMFYTTETGFKIGEITLAGGRDHHLWDHFPDVVGEWFKAQGCKFIDIVAGRGGWEKLYRDRGFSKRYIILRKGLENG